MIVAVTAHLPARIKSNRVGMLFILFILGFIYFEKDSKYNSYFNPFDQAIQLPIFKNIRARELNRKRAIAITTRTTSMQLKGI